MVLCRNIFNMDSGPLFLRVYRNDQLPSCISAGVPLTSTHLGQQLLRKTSRADSGPLLGCWLGNDMLLKGTTS